MAGGTLGSDDRRRTVPELRGSSRTTASVRPCSLGGLSPSSSNSTGASRSSRSGARSSGRERTKATASPRFEVRGPRPRSAQRTRFGRDSADASVSTPFVRTSSPLARWSIRFAPTDGCSWTTSTPAAGERLTRADPRELQQVRRPDRACAQDDLAHAAHLVFRLVPVRAERNTDGTPALEEHASDERVRDDREVRAASRRRVVAVEHAEAPSSPLGHGDEADTLVVLAVEICGERNSGGLRGVDEGLGEDVPVGKIGERKRPLLAARERRLDVVPRPTRAARCRPAVVVGTRTAEHHHGVHRGGAAEHPPTRKHDLASVERRLRRRRVSPVDLRAVELRERRRDPHVQLARAWPGLDQQHRDVRVLREARGENAAGRPTADDHDVVHAPRIGRHGLGTKPCPTRDALRA